MSRYSSPQLPSFPTAPLPVGSLAPYFPQPLDYTGDAVLMRLASLERRVAELEARLQPAVEEVAGDSRNWFEVLWTV